MSKQTKLLAIMSVTLAMTACFDRNSRYGSQSPRNGNSILASVGGIDAGDEKRDEVKFKLVCKSGLTSEGQIKDQKLIQFADSKLVDGEECALEVTAKADPMISTWYGLDKNAQPLVGLYYSSNYAVIKDRKLSLSLYKLYSSPAKDPFMAQMIVNFPEAAALGDNVKMSGVLECSSIQLPAGAPEIVAGKNSQRNFWFKDLSISKLKDAVCTKFTVLVDKAPAFEVVLPKDSKLFAAAEERKTLQLAPISVAAYVAPAQVVVETTPAIKCESFDATTKKCLEFVLPRATGNIWAAVVNAKDKSGAALKVAVLPASGSSPDLSGNKKSLQQMRAELANGNQPVFLFKQHAWMMGKVASNLSDSVVETAQDVSVDKSGLVLESIEEVYVWGFAEVSAAQMIERLNKVSDIRWYSMIDAHKDENRLQLVVAGGAKYLKTAKAANAQVTPFSWADFVADKSDKYAAFGVAGGIDTLSKIPTACKLKASYYSEDIASIKVDAMDKANAGLDACVLAGLDRATLADWNHTETIHVLQWTLMTQK
jgi:hypothetical protein